MRNRGFPWLQVLIFLSLRTSVGLREQILRLLAAILADASLAGADEGWNAGAEKRHRPGRFHRGEYARPPASIPTARAPDRRSHPRSSPDPPTLIGEPDGGRGGPRRVAKTLFQISRNRQIRRVRLRECIQASCNRITEAALLGRSYLVSGNPISKIVDASARFLRHETRIERHGKNPGDHPLHQTGSNDQTKRTPPREPQYRRRKSKIKKIQPSGARSCPGPASGGSFVH